jgi:FdhD protein
MMADRPGSRVRTTTRVVDGPSERLRTDQLATEEPLEIRLAAGGNRKTVAITMRTPGSDFELAAGFLFSEAIISSPADVRAIRYCTDPDVDAEQQYNIVTVDLAAPALPDLRGLERHFYTSSACGVCGKAALDALEIRGCPVIGGGFQTPSDLLYGLPEKLRAAQGVFESTGGLHAAGLFDERGNLVAAREDVGRHNAVDKLVGWALLSGRLPLSRNIVMVSGRASYEIMQKCVVAGVPVVCAVSAPSSLAVSVAERFGVTLVGFLRGRRFNVYSGFDRVVIPELTP